MNVSAGGVGAEAWDASIIMANWLTCNSSYLRGSTIHELGAGVGLPGLVAARYCRRSIISDYVPILIENLQYNIHLNGNRDLGQHPKKHWTADTEHIFTANTCHTHESCNCQGYEDELWRTIQREEAQKQEEDGNEEKTWRTPGFTVPTSDSVEKNRKSMSTNVSHSAIPYLLDWMEFKDLPEVEKDKLKADIILGSEISYIQNRDTLESLLTVINETLSPSGAAYFVQSVDRGTHDDLLAGMRDLGFTIDVVDVPAHILQYYSTGQLMEQYRYYSFRRPDSTFPVMGL